MARVLVTGATGFIGSHLVPALLGAGHQVVLLLREPDRMGTPLPPQLQRVLSQVDSVYADLRDAEQTSRAVCEAKPERIVHLAAAGASDPFLAIEEALAVNVVGTLNLLTAAFRAKSLPQQVVIARTPGEHASLNVYAASKSAAWQFARMYVRTQQWPIAGAMIFQAYGPGQPSHTVLTAAMGAALRNEDFPMTSGIQMRDWIYISDVVTAFVALLATDLSPGTTVELGSGKPVAVRDVIERLFRLVGGTGRPLPGKLEDRPGEVLHQCAKVKETAALIGWRSRVSLDEGLRRLLECELRST